MRQKLLILLLALSPFAASATDYLVVIPADAFAYVPNDLTVVEGDRVSFDYSGFHPLRQVIALNSTVTAPNALLCDETTPICERVMEQAGDFFYICVSHHQTHDMFGRVRVLPQLVFADSLED